MTRNANSKRGRRSLQAVNALLLLAGVVGAYQLSVANKRPPSFHQGGAFADADTLIRAGKDGRPFPYGDATSLTSTSTTTPRVAAAAGVAPRMPSTSVAVLGERVEATAPVVARNGVYRYAVTGSEGASGFGSRDFPETMSLVVHANDQPDQRVFDLRFSEDHEEREIVRYAPDGIAFVYEAGSITFGPGTQTSEGTYRPPMVQVPLPLETGRSANAASAALDPGSGNSQRTERWKTTIVGTETLNVLGAPHQTWVIEIQRNTPPGATDEVDRYRKYWYDPSLGIWVKWVERFTGKRNGVVTFGYKANYTATLAAFTPA